MSAAVTLSDVAELVMGQSPPSTSYNDIGNGLPFYQGKTDFGATYPTPRIYCSEPKKFAEEGDILMSVRAPVGATNLCKSKSCIGRGIAAIRTNGIDRDFLYFYLKKIEAYIDSLGSGAIFKAINKSQLAELPVNDAGISLPEQKKIAHILLTVQRAIEAQERIIQTTTELKKAVMHKLFTEGLRNEPRKQTAIGSVPESWKVVRIKSTGTVVTGSTPSTKEPAFYGEGYNLISPADLDNGKYVRSAHKTLTKAGFAKCRSVPAESVLVGCIGNVGKLGMVSDDRSATNQQINTVVPNSEFNPHFLYYSLQRCRPRLEQAAARVTVPILNKSNFENFQIAAPRRQEQDEIAKCIGVLDQKLEATGQKKIKLQDLFRTLLHELMTAKIRVHELSIGITH